MPDLNRRRDRARRGARARRASGQKPDREGAAERMARGYAKRPTGAHVARALERQRAEREAAERALREARAARLARRGKDARKGKR